MFKRIASITMALAFCLAAVPNVLACRNCCKHQQLEEIVAQANVALADLTNLARVADVNADDIEL